MGYKVIVAHPERQHSFKLASALKKNGLLCKYVTTVYNKSTSLLMRFTKLFLSRENLHRANKRINPDLSEDEVVQFCELSGLLQIALYRFDKSKRIYNWWHKNTSRRFGKKAARLAIKEKADAVILYDANAMTCFEYLKEKAPNIKRIMDTSAANRLFMKDIYERDMRLCPLLADRLKKERDFLWRGNYCKLLARELAATQYFLAPSDFVKESLLFSGISEEQIMICPYGTNFTAIEASELPAIAQDGPLRAVYVGNVTQMKGVYYLLEAALQIPKEKLQLTFVGAFENGDGRFNKYLDRVTFTGRVTHEKVQEVLMASDVFVFPSLGEGMSLSVLEAMSCGLPCVVSANSGVREAIEEGKTGFVVKPQSISELVERLEWCIAHKSALEAMRQDVLDAAKRYSWDKYDASVAKIVCSIIAE